MQIRVEVEDLEFGAEVRFQLDVKLLRRIREEIHLAIVFHAPLLHGFDGADQDTLRPKLVVLGAEQHGVGDLAAAE